MNKNMEVGLSSPTTLEQIKMASKCVIIVAGVSRTNVLLFNALKSKPTIDLDISVLIFG